MISVDLILAARKSPDIPNEYSEKSLKLALDRYTKFLKLAQTHKGKGLVPSIDIDMMWHLHMLKPRQYHQDCMELFGDFLDHDGGFGSVPEEEDEHKESSAMTARLWKEEFNEEYIEAGKLDKAAQCRRACTESCSIKCQ